MYLPNVIRPAGRVLGLLTGLVPFSIAEVGAGLLLAWLCVRGWQGFRAAPNRWRWGGGVLARALALGSFGYAVFMALWGLAYRREPIAGALGLSVRESTVEELRQLMAASVANTNAARTLAPEDSSGVATWATSLPDTIARAQLAFVAAASTHPWLGGRYARAKTVFISPLLSYSGFGGIYIPFTAEPNFNTTLPAFDHPFTIAHEIAHQRGVAREDEANFVGWLVCMRHGDPDFRYSAALQGTQYVYRALATVDHDAARAQWGSLSPAVQRDLEARRAWHARYESPLGEVGSRVNHAYLKSNGVSDGVASYGRVVDLMLADARQVRAP